MDAENKKGIGLAALVAIIVSGAIGGGVFNLSNDLATNASTWWCCHFMDRYWFWYINVGFITESFGGKQT